MTEERIINNRNKLFDEPMVEMLISQKFNSSKVKFMRSGSYSDSKVHCLVNGHSQILNVNRNSSKYCYSSNFTLSLDKNKLGVFNNSIFTFIDEVADSIYIVSGIKLLAYVIEHVDCIQQSEANPKKSWILIPKKDIVNLIVDNPNSTIHYNKKIAKLFATNRDESLYREN